MGRHKARGSAKARPLRENIQNCRVMSQQQDFQESSDQSTNEGEQWQGQVPPLQSPLPWLVQGKGQTSEGPKSEHPSTYDQSIPPLSYGAQDYRRASSSSPNVRESVKGGAGTKGRTSERGGASSRVGDSTGVGTSPRVGTSPTPTGEAGYRQYSGGWQVPPWARPQQNNFGAVWLYVLVIMAILVFPMLCVLVQLVALTVLFILGILLLAFTAIAILWAIRKIDRIKPPSWW